MSRPNSTPFAHATQVANIWTGEIAKNLRVSRHSAWSILCAVLHTLRDRLSAEQVAHLGSQLPLMVRGALFDQWRPGHKAKKIHKEAEFLGLIRRRLPPSVKVEPKSAAIAIFAVLAHHPTGGIRKIVRTLPPDIRALAQQPAPPDTDESPFDWE